MKPIQSKLIACWYAALHPPFAPDCLRVLRSGSAEVGKSRPAGRTAKSTGLPSGRDGSRVAGESHATRRTDRTQPLRDCTQPTDKRSRCRRSDRGQSRVPFSRGLTRLADRVLKRHPGSPVHFSLYLIALGHQYDVCRGRPAHRRQTLGLLFVPIIGEVPVPNRPGGGQVIHENRTPVPPYIVPPIWVMPPILVHLFDDTLSA